jgi:hypothetical protein
MSERSMKTPMILITEAEASKSSDVAMAVLEPLFRQVQCFHHGSIGSVNQLLHTQ